MEHHINATRQTYVQVRRINASDTQENDARETNTRRLITASIITSERDYFTVAVIAWHSIAYTDEYDVAVVVKPRVDPMASPCEDLEGLNP